LAPAPRLIRVLCHGRACRTRIEFAGKGPIMEVGMRAVDAANNRRILHWTVAAAFILMFATGLILFVPALSGLAAGGWTRLVHRGAAVLLVAAPIIYALFNTSSAGQWLQDAAFWRKRPASPANRSNIWKRTHRLLITIGFVFVVATGAIQWFLKGIVPGQAFQWSLSIHDVFFFAAGLVLLYHLYHEVDWWLWKRRHCRHCDLVYCVDACPVRALVRTADGAVDYYRQRCNNCRQCLESCRGQHYYKKVPDAEVGGAVGNQERGETAVM
jgi:cytochrome b subunit of formate dehydrogenase